MKKFAVCALVLGSKSGRRCGRRVRAGTTGVGADGVRRRRWRRRGWVTAHSIIRAITTTAISNTTARLQLDQTSLPDVSPPVVPFRVSAPGSVHR